MTERRARARFAAAGLVLLACWEVAVLVSARLATPTPADWRAASAAIPAPLRDDQLIVFAPGWIEPVGRRWFGDRLTIAHVARMDAERYREVWEVSVRGLRAPELAGGRAASEERFGAIRLRRFIRDAPRVTWSTTVGARICEVDFEPRLGVVLDLHHPFAQARREFQRVELGNELQVYAGLADYQKRSRNDGRALIQVLVDGREVSRRFAGNDDGWVALPTAATEAGLHDVEVVARVQNARQQTDLAVCVAAEARSRRR